MLIPGRNFYIKGRYFSKFCRIAVMVTAIEVCVLLAVSLALWQDSGFGGGWRLAVLVCSVTAAACGSWLGWGWYKLVSQIKYVAGKFGDENIAVSCISDLEQEGQTDNIAIVKLYEAIRNLFRGKNSYISELENQIKDLQLNIRLLQKQKLKTESIIYSVRDAIIVVDEYDKLLITNESAGKLFNFDFKNCQQRSITELIDDSKSGFVEFLRRSRKTRARHTKYELEILKGDEPKIFSCIASCIHDENNNVCGVVAVLHDITRVKEVSQMKNDFVNHVSHELKTPLASITAYSEMLLEDEAGTEEMRKEFCTVIQSQAQRLNRLIEDILNVSRIESGLVKVEKKPISLAVLIKEQTRMLKSYAEEKNITIMGNELIVYDQVYADKDMITQVIVNLLSNAIKYTPEGGTVKIETEVDEVSGLSRVSVTDTGVGIPEDDIDHVFDKFFRVDENKKKAKGTGLGLNLVKQIIEKVHNGRVFVRSKVGVGSTFGFELPLAKKEVVGNKT